jgi:MFS family permease
MVEHAAMPGTGAGLATGAGDSRRASTLAWYSLSVLLLTTLLAYVVRQMLSLIAPSLQTSLGFSDLQIGMLQGLGMAIFASVASYPMGWLADRYGRRSLLAIGIACWSLATALSALQTGFSGLFLGTIGIALGEAGLAPIVYAMIPDLFPERQRNSANLVFYAGSLLGAGIGMALGGAMLQWLAGAQHVLPAWAAGIDAWRIAMIAVALPGPLFVLLVATMPLGARSAGQARRDAGGDGHMHAFLPYARVHWRTLASIFGAIFAMGLAMTSCLVWFPIALPRAFGVDPAGVGVDLGLAIAVATLLGVALPAIALKLRGRDRDRGPIAVARIFFALAPLPAICLPFVTSPFQAYAVATLQGTMGVAGSAMIPGVLQSLAPAHLRSRVLALLGIVNALAMAASPMAIGALSGLISGPRGMLLAIALVGAPALVAAAVLISLARRPYAATLQAISMQTSENAA